MSAAQKLAIQLETVDALVAAFRDRWDFEEDDNKMIEEFKESLRKAAGKKASKKKSAAADDDAPPKAKRAPSEYNLFVQSKKDELIAAGFKGKDLIREAARLWKDHNKSGDKE